MANGLAIKPHDGGTAFGRLKLPAKMTGIKLHHRKVAASRLNVMQSGEWHLLVSALPAMLFPYALTNALQQRKVGTAIDRDVGAHDIAVGGRSQQ